MKEREREKEKERKEGIKKEKERKQGKRKEGKTSLHIFEPIDWAHFSYCKVSSCAFGKIKANSTSHSPDV